MQKFEEPVQNLRGDIIALAPMLVMVAGTETPATVFSDAAGQTPINELRTDRTGVCVFYAPNGRYDIYVMINGLRVGHKLDHLLFDIADSGIEARVDDAASAVQSIPEQLAATYGSSLIGNGEESVAESFNALQLADYVALRQYAGPRKSVYVTGYFATSVPIGIAGMFVRDNSDTTSTDNGGTVIVAGNGKRWKRQFTGPVSNLWFGAKGDGTTDDTAALNAWLAYLTTNTASKQKCGYWNAGAYKISGSGLTLPIGDYMPPMLTDGAEQVRVFGNATTLLTIVATGGSGMIPTVEWGGIKLDGVTNTGTNEGIRVSGVGFFTGRGWHFANLGIAIRHYNVAAGSFSEGVVFDDASFDTTVTNWVRYSKGAGDGSFRGSGLRNFKGNLGATAGPAILIDNGCVPYFAPMSGAIWNYNANGVFIRNNSSQVPFIGVLDTETQNNNANKLTLADNTGNGYTFLVGSVLGWNVGSTNLRLGKLYTVNNYLNTNDGKGQIFQPTMMVGQVVTTAVGQRMKVPVQFGATKPHIQGMAILSVCVTVSNGYYWQGFYIVSPGATDNIINAAALPGGGIVDPTGSYNLVTVSQGNDTSVWFDNANLPIGAQLSYTLSYQHGVILQ